MSLDDRTERLCSKPQPGPTILLQEPEGVQVPLKAQVSHHLRANQAGEPLGCDCHAHEGPRTSKAWRPREMVYLTLCFPRSQLQCLLYRYPASRSSECSMWLWLGAKPWHCSQHGTTLTVPGRSPLSIMIGEELGYRWPGSLNRPVKTWSLH